MTMVGIVNNVHVHDGRHNHSFSGDDEDSQPEDCQSSASLDAQAAVYELRTTVQRLRPYTEDGFLERINSRSVVEKITHAFDGYRQELNRREAELKELVRVATEKELQYVLSGQQCLQEILTKAEGVLYVSQLVLGQSEQSGSDSIDADCLNIQQDCSQIRDDLSAAEEAFPKTSTCMFMGEDKSFKNYISTYGEICSVVETGSQNTTGNLLNPEVYSFGHVSPSLLVDSRILVFTFALVVTILALWFPTKHRDYSQYVYVAHRQLERQPLDMTCSQQGNLIFSDEHGIKSVDDASRKEHIFVMGADTTRFVVDDLGTIYTGVKNKAIVKVFNEKGAPMYDISLREDPTMQMTILAITIDEFDQLYIARKFIYKRKYNVEVYTTEGLYMACLLREESLPKVYQHEVYRMSIVMLGQNQISIADLRKITIFTFDADFVIASRQDHTVAFESVNDMVVDDYGDMLLADWRGGRVIVMGQNGTRLDHIQTEELQHPTRLALCPSGELYVYDINQKYIVKLSKPV